MKKSKLWILLLLIIPCCFIFTACNFNLESDNNTNYVTNIEKTTETDTTDTYLVTYADKTTTLITIENGKDGVDGQDLTLEELKKYCEEKNISLDDFIKEHLTIEYQAPSNTVSTATKKALKSTVSVWCEISTTSGTSVACGAGVIYQMNSTYSYIITNFHVVYDPSCITSNKIASKITVFTYGSQEAIYKENGVVKYGYGAIECSYIGGAMNYDIAILKAKTEDIKKFQPSAVAVTIADHYSAGDTAIAIGNPESSGTSVTSGVVSTYSEDLSMTGADNSTQVKFRVMRIDTSVNSGNSGGGLFDIEGKLIGIVNAKVSSTSVENIAYALPYDNVTKVADNIIYYNAQTNSIAQVKKLTLGITYTTTNNRSVFKDTVDGTEIYLYNDCKVIEVTENSVGHTMGIQANDFITGATIIRGGVQTTYTFDQAHELADLLLTIRVGDELILKVQRGDVTVSTTSSTITDEMLSIIA